MQALADLSGQARLWIYGFERNLSMAETAQVTAVLEAFCSQWQSHGAKVKCGSVVVERHFAILAGEIPGGEISGCGIDSSVRIFKELRDANGLNALNHSLVHYRHEGEIATASRLVFQKLVQEGVVSQDTPVFDLTIETLSSLRGGKFEQPMHASWHGEAFKVRV